MKWTRRILIAVIILAGLITALWWEENWRGQKIWEESCARLRAAGEPVEVADIIPPMIPDEENVAAAPIFAEVAASSHESRASTRLGMIGSEWKFRGPYGNESIPRSRPMSRGDLSQVIRWAEFLRGAFPANAPTQHITDPRDEVLHYYSKWNTEWQEVRKALKRPQCRWPLEYELGINMPVVHLPCFQQLANNTRGWIFALGAKEDAASYVELLTMMLELERCVGEHPDTLISHLVGSTMLMNTLRAWQNSLPLVSLNEAQLFHLQTLLERLTFRDCVTAQRRDYVIFGNYCLRAPAVELVQALQTLNTRPHRWPEVAWPLEDRLFSLIFICRPKGWQLADMATLQDSLRTIGAGCIDEDAHVMNRSRVDAIKSNADRIAAKQGWHTFSRHILGETASIHQKILVRTANTQATVRSAIVWCAAERFRLQYGHLPKSQEELVPGFLKSLLSDPIDGRPLRFIAKEDGTLVVYSLGWDGRDDSGVRGKRPDEGDFGWASDPMVLASPDEIREWAEEDKERSDRTNSPPSAKKPSRGKFK